MKKVVFGLGVLMLGLGSCNQRSDEKAYKDVCEKFDALDAEMLELINQVKAQHSGDDTFLRKFNMEQVFWIQYRDTHLEALYPRDWDRHFRKTYGKEVFNTCKCQEMSRFTKARIKELELWLNDGPSDQQDCPSLWNKK